MRSEGVVQEGALALSLGWDPIAYLDLRGVEAIVGREILQEAADKRAEHEKQRWKNMAGAVQQGVARAFKGGKK